MAVITLSRQFGSGGTDIRMIQGNPLKGKKVTGRIRAIAFGWSDSVDSDFKMIPSRVIPDLHHHFWQDLHERFVKFFHQFQLQAVAAGE